MREFLDKTIDLFMNRVHVVILDLQAPTRRDPQGIHGAIWDEVSDDSYAGPPEKPFTAASYEATHLVRAFVERLGVGDAWPETPLFLLPDAQVPLPTEETYQTAFQAVPRQLRAALELPG
jgi:hypothetical protein